MLGNKMRIIVLLVFILYILFNSSTFASNITQLMLISETLTNESNRKLFFSERLSQADKEKLNIFLLSLPNELLDISLLNYLDDLESQEYYLQQHQFVFIKNERALSHRKILHFLLHQFDTRNQSSRSKEWRQFSGWKHAWFGLKITANNSDSRAYAEPYGKRNPSEDFVATAEHFILAPTSTIEQTIKCRLPLKYNYIKSLFPSFFSLLEQDYIICRDKSDGILDDMIFRDPDTGNEINLGPINENTVTGFELLYATPGTGDASEIAGHLLLRVKLNNNSEADALGIENPNDLVISFLANTGTVPQSQRTELDSIPKECKKSWLDLGDKNKSSGQSNFVALHAILQSLKGLSGGFLTLMDRQPLSQAIKNYTIEEDRDLLRYKLELTAEQKHRLLEQLYRAKKNYNAKYYFFYQNCASVLVKVIGMGIQSKKITEFNPIVSPPNSLVALFIREGLAKPIRPAFYSYRKKAFLAQDLITTYYQKLQEDYSNLAWPNIKSLFKKKSNTRLDTLNAIAKNIGHDVGLDIRLNQLFILVQEAEMAYEHKDLVCQQYTSEVTSQARLYQRDLILSSIPIVSSISTDTLLSEKFSITENTAFNQGVPHTKLLAYAIGGGHYQNSQNFNSALLSLNLTLDEQQLGSISNIAMQRSSYVKLVSTQINFSNTNKLDLENNILSWHFTALDVRKFKDRLNRVPSYFSSAGTIGLGLSVLDFEKDYTLGIERGTWIGGEVLFNLISSAEHNDYIYTSVGLDLRHQKYLDSSSTEVMLPVRMETLLTFDKNRRLQWRNNFEYRFSTDTLEDEFELSTGLTYRMGEVAGRLVLFRLSSEYKQLGSNIDSLTTWMGVEINPY